MYGGVAKTIAYTKVFRCRMTAASSCFKMQRSSGWAKNSSDGDSRYPRAELDKSRHLVKRDRGSHIAPWIDRIDHDQRFVKGLCRMVFDINNDMRPPPGSCLKKGGEPAVMEDEQFAQVPENPSVIWSDP